jgi:hypothetical protein
MLEIDDKIKQYEKEDKLKYDPRLAEEGSIQAKIERLFDRDYGQLSNSVQEELKSKAKQILDDQKISTQKPNRFKDGKEAQGGNATNATVSNEVVGKKKSNRVIFKRKNVMVDDRNFIDYQKYQNK